MKGWTLLIALLGSVPSGTVMAKQPGARVQKAKPAPTYPAMKVEWKGKTLNFAPFYDSGQARTRAFLRLWGAGIPCHPRLLFAMYGIWYRYGLPSRTRIVAATRDELTIEAPGLPVGRAGIYAKRFGVKSEVKGSRLTLRLR